MMHQYPKVLLLSNECISTISSNGRTIRNFLIGWPKENLAQFHLRNVSPDYTVCDNYYYVSDNAALKSFLNGQPIRLDLKSSVQNSGSSSKNSAPARNAVTMLLRELVWNSMRWAGKEFYQWVESFSPELILLQAGDSAFMFKLAKKLALKYKIPLVIYNTEAYYFKCFDYFCSKGLSRLLYPAFHRYFCNVFEQTLKLAKKSIYCCDKLKNDYDKKFGLPSEVIYTATQLEPETQQKENKQLTISYLGNLGVGRHESLIQIANVLQQISTDYKLDVYGKIPSQLVEDVFANCPGIHYKGFVTYEQVVQVMRQSDILIHAENFSEFYTEDSKYAFSTKIADSLASGTCFLLYAPDNLACTQYLKNNDAAYVVSNEKELTEVLENICTNPEQRLKYINQALELVKRNHNADTNSKRFQDILRECAKR